MKEIFAANGGLYLGFPCSNTEGPIQDRQDDPLQYTGDRHLFSFGPNGSGKSRRALLPNLLNTTAWSAVVLDPKGLLAYQTAEARRQAGNDVYFFNPFKVNGLPDSGFNCVECLDIGDDLTDEALTLAEAIITREENRESSHWDNSAEDAVTCGTMYSRLCGPKGGSLGHVRELFGKSPAAFSKEVEKIIEAGSKLGHEEMALKASRFADLDPTNRELLSILSTVNTKLRFVDARPVKRHLATVNKINLAQLRQKPTTIYLILPATKVRRNQPLLRIWISAIVEALMKDIARPKVPVLLALDEASLIGRLPVLHDNLQLMREYAIKVWSFYQDLPLARRTLGRDYVASMIANSGVLQSFQTQDMETAELLSKRSGYRKAELLSYSANVSERTGMPEDGTLKYEEQRLPGILPQTIMNMDPGYSVLFSHRTKGIVRSHFPDPSDMPAFASYASRHPGNKQGDA